MTKSKSEKTFMGKTWDEIMNSKSEREGKDMVKKVGSGLSEHPTGVTKHCGNKKQLSERHPHKADNQPETPSPDNKTETEISKAIEIIQCDLMNKTDIRVWESIAKEHEAHCKRELERWKQVKKWYEERQTIGIFIEKHIEDLQEAVK